MATAMTEIPISSTVDIGTRRHHRAGSLDRMQRSRPRMDGDDHPHYRWTIPSERGTRTRYTLNGA
jgi:hypothetical protein